MTERLAALGLAVAVLLASAAGEARAETVVVDGAVRSYQVFVPRSAAPAAPAIVALHGGSGTAEGLRRYINIERTAAERGVVVLYPQGVDNRWNDGRVIAGGEAPVTTTAADVAFLLAMIDQEAGKGLIDPARVGVAGISNGGMMAQRLACEAPARFAGIAVVAANVPVGLECPGGFPVPAIFFQGTEDRMIPFGGGPIAPRSSIDRGQAYPADRSLEIWAVRNRCGARMLEVQRDDRPLDGTSVRIHHWQGCAADLVQVVIDGGGHTWPGAVAPLYGMVAGRHSREIDANATILDFFFGPGGR